MTVHSGSALLGWVVEETFCIWLLGVTHIGRGGGLHLGLDKAKLVQFLQWIWQNLACWIFSFYDWFSVQVETTGAFYNSGLRWDLQYSWNVWCEMSGVDPDMLQTALLQVAEATKAASDAAKLSDSGVDCSSLSISFLSVIDPNCDEEWKKLFDDPSDGFDISTARSETRLRSSKLCGFQALLVPWKALELQMDTRRCTRWSWFWGPVPTPVD